MAHSNRLFLSQKDYIVACANAVIKGSGEKYILGTWGVSRQTVSMIHLLLYKLNTCQKPVEILVGMNQLSEFGKMINLITQYRFITWRFTEESHAKYFLWKNPGRTGKRWNREWFGFMGSCNLTDSNIWNIGTRLPSSQASEIAHIHDGLWKDAKPASVIAASMKGGLSNLMTRTVVQSNDTGKGVNSTLAR